ncbi:MAG: hypothetical protein O7G87_20035 [bacterium]|nr:hypothetical protein [bacterium]
MKPSFTTLGSPGWSLDEVCQKGSAAGFEGVDFRGLQDNIDITTTPEFTTQLGETKRKLEAYYEWSGEGRTGGETWVDRGC